MKRACKDCEWWGDNYGEWGDCRATPPTFRAGTDKGQWPMTGADQWCGHFVAYKEPEGNRDD